MFGGWDFSLSILEVYLSTGQKRNRSLPPSTGDRLEQKKLKYVSLSKALVNI